MNLHGIGVDVVDVERIEDVIRRHGLHFLERTFTAAERDYCSAQANAAPHFAARFAAKEAVSKAFGTGIGAQAGFLEIEVCRNAVGRPEIVLHGHAADYAQRYGITRVMISLSHTRHSAVAQAVAVVDVPRLVS
jgi:holo-[acyl-carrier protein] synthase